MYHSGGFLPPHFLPQTFVPTPSVFLTDKTKWVIRHLTPKECLEAWGVPSMEVESMIRHQFGTWESILPIESLTAGAKLFGDTDAYMGWGGGYYPDDPH